VAAGVTRLSVALAGVVACAACGSDDTCAAAPTPSGATCHDLTFEGRAYDEWRVVHPTGILQEVGDAFYPACTSAGRCGGDPLDGMGATDVWQLDDVDATEAVIGLRQDTRTYVVFVRAGVDPESLTGLG
jgi:hypothetical protein